MPVVGDGGAGGGFAATLSTLDDAAKRVGATDLTGVLDVDIAVGNLAWALHGSTAASAANQTGGALRDLVVKAQTACTQASDTLTAVAANYTAADGQSASNFNQ